MAGHDFPNSVIIEDHIGKLEYRVCTLRCIIKSPSSPLANHYGVNDARRSSNWLHLAV